MMQILVDGAGLRAALAPYRDRSSRYAGRLSSHLTMALDALARFGAPPERLAGFAARYVATHELPPAGESERALRAQIGAELAAQGRTGVLQRRLPPLFAHTAGDAFHGLIRTAYAVQRDDDDELAAALTAWELAGEPLGMTSSPDAATVPVPAALARLGPVYDAVRLVPRSLIGDRMRTVAAAPAFADALAAAPRAADTAALQRAAGAAFGATRNFVALHVMTASHALAVLITHVADGDAALAAVWPAIAAAWVVAGAPATPDDEETAAIRDAAPATWDPIVAAALASDDEHVIKAAYSAWSLEALTADRLFRWTALRYVPVPKPVPEHGVEPA